MKLSKRTVLEFIGEFLATFLLAIVLLTSPIFAGGISPFVVAFAVMALWYMFSEFSKVHMNPVVTLAEYIVVLFRQLASGKFYWQDLVRALVYMLTQFLAFLAAFPLVNWLRTEYANYYIIQKQYGLSDDIVKTILDSMPLTTTFTVDATNAITFDGLVFVLEFFITFIVVFAFLKMTTSEKFKQYTGLVWGLVIFVAMIIAVQTTGASFNPWRSLVPAMIEGGTALTQVGVYIFAAVSGGVFAAILYAVLGWLERPGKTTTSRTTTARKTVKKKGKK